MVSCAHRAYVYRTSRSSYPGSANCTPHKPPHEVQDVESSNVDIKAAGTLPVIPEEHAVECTIARACWRASAGVFEIVLAPNERLRGESPDAVSAGWAWQGRMFRCNAECLARQRPNPFAYSCDNEPGSSENHAFGAASTSVLPWPAVAVLFSSVAVVVRLPGRSVASAASRVVASGLTRRWCVRSLFAELSNNVEEGSLHVDAVLCRSLHELAAKLLRKSAAFLCGDFSFRDAVALVADKHDWCGSEGRVHRLGEW